MLLLGLSLPAPPTHTPPEKQHGPLGNGWIATAVATLMLEEMTGLGFVF